MLNHQRSLFATITGVVIVYLLYFHGQVPRSFRAVQEIEILESEDVESPHEPPPIVEHHHFTGLLADSPSVATKTHSAHSTYTGITDNVASKLLQSNTSYTGSDSSFDGLLNLCKQTKWTDGLWLHCHSNCGENNTSLCGGLTNARNRVQTCLRLAIDTGAGVIIPSITTRSEEELLNTNDKTVCSEFFWNIEYLQEAMAEQCPQLKFRKCGDRSGISKVIEPPFRAYLEPPYYNTTFRKLVMETIENSNITLADITPSAPAVISFGDSYIGFNYYAAKEQSTIRKALFKVLKFNQDLLDLSAEVLKSEQLHKGAFIGVHLRGESDWPAGFGPVDAQMQAYISEIEKIQSTVSYDMKTVYVSCGDADVIQKFRLMLQPLGYTVHDKFTLLSDRNKTLDKVEALSFDQKAIVEYQVLVEARFWIGVIMSSYSSLIAYARTVDDPEDLFDTYIFPNSTKSGLNRGYPEPMAVKGSQDTKLMVVNGVDIMEAFP